MRSHSNDAAIYLKIVSNFEMKAKMHVQIHTERKYVLPFQGFSHKIHMNCFPNEISNSACQSTNQAMKSKEFCTLLKNK